MSVKIHFLSSHLDFLPENCGSVSEDHGEHLHQDIAAKEGRCKKKWRPSMLADYCWILMCHSPNSTFNRQAKKARLHYSYTQTPTYDVVKVRDDSLKTAANEAFLLWFSCSALQFTRVIQKISSVCEYCLCSTAVTVVRMRAEFVDSVARDGRNLQTFE